jgi:hypothetical protein
MFARVITAEAGSAGIDAVGQGQPRGIRDEGGSAEVLTTMDLETYEVALRA